MPVDLDHLFLEALPPPYWLALLQDLELEALLTGPQRVQAEDAVLACVDAHGQWKTTADGPEAA
jgi:hypothetical protein